MVFNSQIIEKLKEKSGLGFDKSKDFEILCDAIFQQTGRTIGITTMKRLMGYISDNRHTNEYTLNTIGIYLGYASWETLCATLRVDSEWNFEDETYYVEDLSEGSCIRVKYLNRVVIFDIISYEGTKVLRVKESENSSLKEGDVLFVEHLRRGEILEAKKVIRGESKGNYRTNGELKDVEINPVLHYNDDSGTGTKSPFGKGIVS